MENKAASTATSTFHNAAALLTPIRTAELCVQNTLGHRIDQSLRTAFCNIGLARRPQIKTRRKKKEKKKEKSVFSLPRLSPSPLFSGQKVWTYCVSRDLVIWFVQPPAGQSIWCMFCSSVCCTYICVCYSTVCVCV